MKFNKSRNLSNKVFSVSIERTNKNDSNYNAERILEDDFGSVQIDIGGRFYVAYVEDEGIITAHPVFNYEESVWVDSLDKYIIDTNIVSLTVGAKIQYQCDAKQLNKIQFALGNISPIKIAENRCIAFEAIIEDRINKAVELWKENQSDFEQELDGFEVSLLEVN